MIRTPSGSAGRSQRRTAPVRSECCRETGAADWLAALGAQAADQAAQVRAALGSDERVQLVDHDEGEGLKDLGEPMGVIHEERLDRLGCDQQDARGVFEQASFR